MKVEIRKITNNDIEIVSELLTESFVEDKGIIVLFKKNDLKYKPKVNQWFKSTLKMLINNEQNIHCAFLGDELVGVSIVTHTSYQPSILSLLKWTYSVVMTCGMTTVKRTAEHDKRRNDTFTDKNQYILEFIAVNKNKRGNSIGKQLFESLEGLVNNKSASVWLETTKENNIVIFNNLGYNLIDTKSELSVNYYIMTKEKSA